MTEALQQKLIDGVIKGVVAAATGGGLASFSTTWVGEAAFASFQRRLNAGGQVIFPAEPLPQLLQAWSGRVLDDSLDGLQAALLVLLVALLALVAHVVVRGSLQPGETNESAEGGAAGAGPAAAAAAPSAARLRGLYGRFHGALTLALFLVLAALLWRAPSPAVLTACFALLMVPGALYLVLYAADVRRPRFAPRFTWIACAMLIFTALLTAPRVYGDRFFDVELVQVVSEDGSRATFAFLDAPSVVCDIEFDDRSLVVWIREQDGRWERAGSETSTLADLLERRQPPVLAASAAASEVDRILAATLED
jgi:hypothetical protein